jgi:hypothetical protein
MGWGNLARFQQSYRQNEEEKAYVGQKKGILFIFYPS